MLELSKEKSYTVKDKKLNLLFKQTVMYDKFKSLKFMCAEITCRPREYDTSIFIGLSNGHIFTLNLSKQKSVRFLINIHLNTLSSFINLKKSTFFSAKKNLNTKDLYIP